MKIKKIILVAFALLLVGYTVNAQNKVWRVNNRYHVDADFNNIQAAVNAASAGDTIYIEGRDASYGQNVSINKKLTIIGTGNFFGWNDSTQAYKHDSYTNQYWFNVGSAGSILTGCYAGRVWVGDSNITIARNFINADMHLGWDSWDNSAISVRSSGTLNGCTNTVIKQNYIQVNHDYHYERYGYKHKYKHHCYTAGIYIDEKPDNIVICNNVIIVKQLNSGYKYAIVQGHSDETNKLQIQNNIFRGGYLHTQFAFWCNNIIIGCGPSGFNNNHTANNIISAEQFPDENNNVRNVDMTTVFSVANPVMDNEFKLSTTSPAKGAGILGGDCGVFDNKAGGEPYYLSTMPGIPAIFESTYGNFGMSTLPVNIKSKSHKRTIN